MSLAAQLWALYKAPSGDAQSVLILCALAEHANPDGTGAYPSIAALAFAGRCSERTAQRHIRTLLADGLIAKGNQKLAYALATDRRPTVYDLQMDQQRGDRLTPRRRYGEGAPSEVTKQANGVTLEAERGDISGTDGATGVSPEPKDEPTTEPKTPATVVAEGSGHKVLSPERQAAEVVVKEFWEESTPRPVINGGYIALVKMAQRFIEAGFTANQMHWALRHTRAFTIDAITFTIRTAIEERAKAEGPGRHLQANLEALEILRSRQPEIGS